MRSGRTMTTVSPQRRDKRSAVFRRSQFPIRCRTSSFAALLLLSALHPLFAQDQKSQEKQVEVSEGVRLTLPFLWGVTRQTLDTVEIDYPVRSSAEAKPKFDPLAAPSVQIMVFV